MTTAEHDVDYWPTPDQATLENAAMAYVDQHGYTTEAERVTLLAQVLADPAFNRAVAAIWADRLPTPDSIHRAYRALDRHHARRHAIQAVLDQWKVRRLEVGANPDFVNLYDEVTAAMQQAN